MRVSFGFLSFVFATTLSQGQSAKGNSLPPFESPHPLDAEMILRSEFIRGEHFSVRREVPTSKGINFYTIDSDYGVFTAEGNSALVQRISEIRAIAQLREISKSDSYQKALKEAAKSPIQLAESAIKHPVDTAGNVTRGVWKMLNSAGQSVKEVGQGRKQSKYEDTAAESAIGLSTA